MIGIAISVSIKILQKGESAIDAITKKILTAGSIMAVNFLVSVLLKDNKLMILSTVVSWSEGPLSLRSRKRFYLTFFKDLHQSRTSVWFEIRWLEATKTSHLSSSLLLKKQPSHWKRAMHLISKSEAKKLLSCIRRQNKTMNFLPAHTTSNAEAWGHADKQKYQKTHQIITSGRDKCKLRRRKSAHL